MARSVAIFIFALIALRVTVFLAPDVPLTQTVVGIAFQLILLVIGVYLFRFNKRETQLPRRQYVLALLSISVACNFSGITLLILRLLTA